jgi:hypothetical protein
MIPPRIPGKHGLNDALSSFLVSFVEFLDLTIYARITHSGKREVLVLLKMLLIPLVYK